MSFTSVVGICSDSLAIMGVDAKVTSEGYSNALSNNSDKTIVVGPVGKDPTVYMGFSGDSGLRSTIKKVVVEVIRENPCPTPHLLAKIVKEQMKIVVKEEKIICYGVIIFGVGSNGKLEMYRVSSDFPPGEKKPMKVTFDKISGFCVAGSGGIWMQPLLAAREAELQGMSLEDAKILVRDCLNEATKHDVASGGLHHTLAITKEGDRQFTHHDFYDEPICYDCCSIGYRPLVTVPVMEDSD